MLWIFACGGEKTDSAHLHDTVLIEGTILEVLGGIPIKDVQVCSQIECKTTNSDGVYSIHVPRGQQRVLFDKAEYVSGLININPETMTRIANVSLVTEALYNAQLETVDLSTEPEKGGIAFSISNGILGDGINVANVEVSLSVGADGPFYTNDLGLPVTTLTETSANGGGVFVNVGSGKHELDHEGIDELDCTTILGWNGPQTVSLTVEADRISFVRIECL